MKVKVNEDSCIGCGACQSICENVFEINDEGLSSVKVEKVSEDDVQSVRDAADSCPTSAISMEENSNNEDYNPTKEDNCECGCDDCHSERCP